jgi:hypothetical protein
MLSDFLSYQNDHPGHSLKFKLRIYRSALGSIFVADPEQSRRGVWRTGSPVSETPVFGYGDWDGRSYARLRGIDRTGLMWEWLRRDPDYVVWHTQASTATRGTKGVADGSAY